MANYTIDNIIGFLIDISGVDDVYPECNIHDELGLKGDDFDEMIIEYSKTYSVDMTDYLWYFHTEEEGSWISIGGSVFDPPDKLVKRIPVTPTMLAEFANIGKWNVIYPDHEIPKKRHDISLNTILVGIAVLWLIICGILKLTS